MLAARLSGNSTYDNPRYGKIRGCRGLPHSLTPLPEGRYVGPCSAGPVLYIQERQRRRR
jgi:hypothetical protein